MNFEKSLDFITEETSRKHIPRLAALRDSRHFQFFFHISYKIKYY